MPFTITPTQDNLTAALGQFVKNLLDTSVWFVTVANPNRVAEPKPSSYVVMSPLRSARLGTNLDAYADVKFTGTTNAGTLTVTSVAFGKIVVPSNLFGVNVPVGTRITAQVNGDPGGVGDYTIDSDTVLTQQTFAGGGFTMQQSIQVTVQVDFHSADRSSWEAAQIFSTAFRDEYATTFFAALAAPLNSISPLYADDARERPFINDQQQFEWVWMVEANLQIDQVIRAPMQYADLIEVALQPVELVNVDDLSLDYSNPDNSQYLPGLI